MKGCTLQKCWDTCLEKSRYEDRNKANQMFNSKSKEVKRGQAIVPIKFFSGGAYEDMEGSALVRVYQGAFLPALRLSVLGWYECYFWYFDSLICYCEK